MGVIIKYIDEKTGNELCHDLVSDEEVKALSTNMVSIVPAVVFFSWYSNVIHTKAKKLIDGIVVEHSDKQPSKISDPERMQIVTQAEVETAVEKNIRLEAEQEAKRQAESGKEV